MFSIARKIYQLLEPNERVQALGVFMLTIVMAFLELVGIASLLPFIAVLAAPEKIHTNEWLSLVYDGLGFENDRQYLLFLGMVVLGLLILTNSVKAFTRWVTLRFSQMRSHTISYKLMTQYLYQPYSYFLQHNTAQLRKSLGEVQGVITNVVIPTMDLVARICVCSAILMLLIFVDPVLAVGSGVVLAGTYTLIYMSMRTWLFKLGQQKLQAMGEKNKVVSEAFHGIKNVKLTGTEESYLEIYRRLSHLVASSTGLNSMVSDLPRYVLEVIAFGGILFIVLYELMKGQDVQQALPMITLYALAGYRLLPNFQAAFSSVTKLRFNASLLDHACIELRETALTRQASGAGRSIEPLVFSREIELRNVSFSYNGSDQAVLENVNLTIPKNSGLGVIGKTGSGKTTLVDIVLGLLSPTSGEILIDGIALTDETRRAWQKNTAYVTQHIYLVDDTIRNNIAFGIPGEVVDDAQVEKAARMSDLHDFIMTLPDQYETSAGENGVRFSGGQRQRIGLARALYLDRPVLVLDEATSALDSDTEETVMTAINRLGGEKTIIMITHRTSSLGQIGRILDMTKADVSNKDAL